MRGGRRLQVARDDEFLQRVQREIGIGAPVAVPRFEREQQLLEQPVVRVRLCDRRERRFRDVVEVVVENPQE